MSNYRSRRERLKREDLDEATTRRSFHKHSASDWDYDTGGWIYNYNHIRRWLEKHVGKPWDQVYSDMTYKFRKRGKSDYSWEHVVKDLVQTKAFLDQNGRPVCFPRFWGKDVLYLDELTTWRYFFYVCPKTKILKKTQKKKYERKREKYFYITVDKKHQIHGIDGIWYMFTMENMPDYQWYEDSEMSGHWGRPEPMDVILDTNNALTRAFLQNAHKPSLRFLHRGDSTREKFRREHYGSPDIYAKNKKQLNHRELKKYNLENLIVQAIEKLKAEKDKEGSI